MDFEALVKGQTAPMPSATDPWADNGWGDSGETDAALVGQYRWE